MIKIEKLDKSYPNDVLYKGASYTFKKEALTCFYGESGSGKTTLLNLLAGFDREYKGSIEVEGISLNKLKEDELAAYRGDHIGFIFQNYYLLKGYTTLENVLMALYHDPVLSDEEQQEKAIEILTTLDLKEEIHQKVETLSGGQKQRVCIARALVNNPSVILADEPTGALDIENSKVIMAILKAVSREKTVIVITHDEEVLKYADEIVTLEDHQIKQVRRAETREVEVLDAPQQTREKTALHKKYRTALAFKNLKVHHAKYIGVLMMLAVSIAAFIGSFSLRDISHSVMGAFQEKNDYYKIGQVEDYSAMSRDEVYEKLHEITDIQDIYLQADLKDTELKYGNQEVELGFNVPSLLATETLAYGRMPEGDAHEIALSASLAGMLHPSIKELVGETLTLVYKDASGNKRDLLLEITGITNNKKQNFILSSQVEKALYKEKQIPKDAFQTIRFEVKDFNKIPEVSRKLEDQGITVAIRTDEIVVFQQTFASLITLFKALAYLIFIVGIVLALIILYKLLDARKGEMALLGAMGYTDDTIKKIVLKESSVLAIGTLAVALILVGILEGVARNVLGYGLGMDLMKIMIIIGAIVLVDIGGTMVLCDKLLKKDKSKLLR